MAKKDDDGVQDQGSLNEPQKSTKPKRKRGQHPDVGEWDPDNPVDRRNDVSLPHRDTPVDEKSLDETQTEDRPVEQA